jgi:hypothetical protein
MKGKTIFLAVFILAIALNTKAQIFTFGPKIGINYSAIVFDETFTHEGIDFTYITKDAKVSFAYGAFARLKLGSFIFQPELIFTKDQTDIELKSINLFEIQTLSINKMDIPLNVGVMIGKFLRIQGGPVMSYIRESSVLSPSRIWTDFKQNRKNVKWAYQIGVGFDIGRFTLDGVMQNNLSKLGSEFSIGNETFYFDHRQRTYQVSIGFKIFK